ncbi:hypothetical protein ACFSCX_10220 [Bacillus salitolerans]|uniref:Uncharacterized protein n=1 Tax=Bacillus salitolerans TaxID=1437434 RepID=A0ABW4LPK6_9BACI
MSSNYEMVLGIANPKDNIDLDFSSDKNSKDLDDAVVYFNNNMAGKKELEILKKGYNRLTVKLRLFVDKEKVTGRDLLNFSQYLYNEKDWKFSSDNNKLFRLIGEPLRIGSGAIDFTTNNLDSDKLKNFTDEKAIKAFETLILMEKMAPDVETKERKRLAILKIKEILISSL